MSNKIGDRSSAIAERAVIGALLVNDNMVSRVIPFLAPIRFATGGLGLVYSVILDLHESRKPVDFVSVSEELSKRGQYDAIGGKDELRAVLDETAFADHAEHYSKIVADLYFEREVVKASRNLAGDQTAENLEKVRALVLAKEQLGLPAAFDYTKDLHDILDDITQKKTGRRHTIGFPTIDRTFDGIAPGEVVTWGAATNTGKSLVLLNIAAHCAAKNEPVLYVGTEMSAKETVARHISIATGIEPYKIRSSRISKDEIGIIHNCLSDRLSVMPMQILDLAEPSLSDVEAALTARRAQVVFLDYLERFKMPAGENYRLRVNDFMRRVKNMARKYDCVIHLASQLSRETYGKEQVRPALSHLSESSAIEKESDRVILMWTPNEKNPPGLGYERVIEIGLAKNRHGRRGVSVDLVLNERSLKISEKDEVPQENFDGDNRG